MVLQAVTSSNQSLLKSTEIASSAKRKTRDRLQVKAQTAVRYLSNNRLQDDARSKVDKNEYEHEKKNKPQQNNTTNTRGTQLLEREQR